MKKMVIALIILLVSQLFQSCHKIDGKGPDVTHTYTPGSFTAIDLSIDADIYYTPGPVSSVQIQAQQNILDVLLVQVYDGTLQVQFEPFKHVRRHDRIIITIITPSLSGITISGSGDIRMLQPVDAGDMSLRVSGSGSISISQITASSLSATISGSGTISAAGVTGSLATRISGSGSINLAQLQSKMASCSTTGSGSTRVWVAGFLDAQISGSGDVYYLGDPSVHTSVSGSGHVGHL